MSRISLLFGLALPVLALAEPRIDIEARINNSGGDYRGAVSVNQAAGRQHQQANGRALAVGAPANIDLRQQQGLELEETEPLLNMRSSIEGAAFANGQGVLGINQSSGAGGQQINAFRVSTGAPVEILDDSILAQQSVVLSRDSGAAESTPGARIVDTDNRAFAGSSGVVQLNQSAGVGNQTANTFSIKVTD